MITAFKYHLSKVDSLIRSQSPVKFHVLQGVLTPSSGVVPKSLPVVSLFTGTKNLERYVTSNEVNDIFLKLLDDSESKGGINICISDFQVIINLLLRSAS